MARIRYFFFVILIIILLCSCGTNKDADGIDSVTYISDIAGQPPSHETASEALPESAFTGVTLAELSGTKFSSSIYLLFLDEALENVLSRYEVSPKDVPSLEVLLEDGSVITAEDFCKTYAKNEFEWVCLLVSDYLGCGGVLSESPHYQSAASKADAAFREHASKYNSLGITLNDLILYYLYTDLYYDDFLLKHSPGGTNEINESDLSALMENNARKISYTYLPFYDELTNRDFSDDEIKQLTELSLDYLKRYRDGESFSDILSENYTLLDSYHLSFDSGETSVYYALSDPMLPAAITACAEKLEENEADLVKAEDFVSVVLRLPVNEIKDEKWTRFALDLAYLSPYGDRFSEEMSAFYDRLQLDYNDKVLDGLSLDKLISSLYPDKQKNT